MFTSDETGLVKKLDVQSGAIQRRWGPGKPIVSIHSNNSELHVVNTAGELFTLDSELNQLKHTQLSFTTAKPLKVLSYGDSLIVAHVDGVIGQIKDDCQQLIYSTKSKLNQVSLYNNYLLMLWTGQAPSVLDLDSHEIRWKARNVKNDEYDVPVKMDDADGAFLDDHTILVATAKRTLRYYDFDTDKSQPLREVDVSKNSPTLLQRVLLTSKYLFVVNLKGEVLAFKRAENMEFIGKLKGTLGSVRDLAMDLDEKYLATVSIDRYLRVYDPETRRVVQQHNLGQRLTSICFVTKCDELEEREVKKQEYTVYTGDDARERFKYVKRHSIELPYLKQMFKNKQEEKNKRKEQERARELQRLQEEEERANQPQPEYEQEQITKPRRVINKIKRVSKTRG